LPRSIRTDDSISGPPWPRRIEGHVIDRKSMADPRRMIEPRPGVAQLRRADQRRPIAPSRVEAARRLAEFGFLVRSDLPDRDGPAVLMVALRERPALTHYDPEDVSYWVSEGGVGRREHLSRATTLPIEGRAFAWGEIRIVDRLHVSNEYLTFGGRLAAAMVDDTVIAVFESPVPLLRRGGHSQGWDEAAENVGAFFGRMKIAVDYVPGFEARLASTRPEACYGAFVADLAERHRSEPLLRETQPQLWSLVASEEHRLARDLPEDLADGRWLLATMRAV
jgi:hypothetical protein